MRTVAILGAAGRFGSHVAIAFQEAGWEVKRVLRPGSRSEGAGEAVFADAMDASSLRKAIGNADFIVNALNPKYSKWTSDLPRLTAPVIAVARESGARVLIPGNVYNYGSSLPEMLTRDTPWSGDHAKAAARIAMEKAWRESGLGVTVLRAGDFFGAPGPESWFEGQIARRITAGRFLYPGPMDRPHAWGFLPDLGRAAVALAEREHVPDGYEEIGFPGHAPDGAELMAAAGLAMGKPLRQGRFPWLPLRALGPFVPMAREVTAMRYLWDRPHRICGKDFQAALPGFRMTPLDEAVAEALAGG